MVGVGAEGFRASVDPDDDLSFRPPAHASFVGILCVLKGESVVEDDFDGAWRVHRQSQARQQTFDRREEEKDSPVVKSRSISFTRATC